MIGRCDQQRKIHGIVGLKSYKWPKRFYKSEKGCDKDKIVKIIGMEKIGGGGGGLPEIEVWSTYFQRCLPPPSQKYRTSCVQAGITMWLADEQLINMDQLLPSIVNAI